MSKIKITCDSTCDLSRELYEKYDVEVIPLYITMGNDQYRDSVDISLPQLFDYVGEYHQLPKTAAVPVQDYIDRFQPYLDQGYSIIHINISSHMSSCHQNAKLAAQELKHVYPIDSLNLSTGSGHLVIAAAEMAQQGLEAKEIADKLNQMARRLEVSFVIDTVEYLRKGGRCSAVAALGANLLRLKPCIEVKDGQMGVGKKYRGSIQKALEQYVSERLEGRNDLQLNRIFITHSLVEPELVKHVRSLVLRYQPFAEVLETVAGCTIGSHCGKGTLGILFFTK